jgi:uncharacterized protein YgiM (DUF1202 family)
MLCLLPLISMADAFYGVVTARSLNLRTAPSEQAAILTSFPSGTRVQVLESSNSWHKVSVSGLTGYMSARYVSLSEVTQVTDAQVSGATGYINLRSAPSASAAVLATFPNGTRVKILGHAGGFYNVQVNGLTGYMADYLVRLDNVNVQTYAVIRTNGSNLNMRSAPSMGAPILQSFAPGQRVEILEKGKEWHKVRAGGIVGYMRAEFLAIGGSQPAPAPMGKVGVVNNPKATQVLNLRETPSLDARVLACYGNGKQVEILGSTGDWYKVSVDGKIGYMLKQYVKVTSTTPPTVKPPATPFSATLKNPNGGSIVNFRAQPGLNSAILAMYPVGKAVTVLESGTDWSKVSVDGSVGYVSSYFLKF